MPKNFVFNMGYDTSHITSVLASEGLEEGSEVVLVTPQERNDRQENSINDIRNYLNSLDFKASLEIFPAGKSFQDDVENFSSLFSNLENVVLSLSGGPRDFLIPMTVAALAEGDNIDKTCFRSDIDSSLKDLELPHFKIELKGSERKVLEAVTDSPKDIADIVSATGLSESTVYRKISELKERGLLEENSDGYEATTVGRNFC